MIFHNIYSLGRQVVLKVWLNVSICSTGHWADTSAAVLPKQTVVSKWNSHFTKPLEQPDTPPRL